MKKLPILYKKTKKGQTQTWEIKVEGDAFFSQEGILGGKISVNKPTVCQGKNLGKANETSPNEQAILEAIAKHTKKLNEGYADSIKGLESVTYEEPMLAKQWEDFVEKMVYPVWVDDKRNGVRCSFKNGILISRKNKVFNTVPHLIKELKAFSEKYPNIFVDGELYNEEYRENLNRLIKLVSVNIKLKDLTPELLSESEEIVQFHIYDAYGYEEVTKNTPFIERRNKIKELIGKSKFLYVLPYKVCANKQEVEELRNESRKLKREGIIIRWGDCPYEHKRSKFLLKYKNFDKDDFEVVKIEEGKGNWVGCAKRIILKLKAPSKRGDTTFDSNVEGSMEEMRELFQNRKKYIGKMASIEFQGYSEYGIPQIGYLREWRDYE